MIHSMFGLHGLPERPVKPRQSGLTLVLDKGMSVREVDDFLDVAADYTDVVKFGWGTAAITPNLDRKIDAYHAAGIPVYFGGTLFEAFYMRRQVDHYRRLLDRLGITHVEISDGTLDIPHEQKISCIRMFAQDFTVLSEVGSKDADHIMPPYKWVQLLRAEIEAGSWKVICEARESGTAGVFRRNGEVRSGLVDEICEMVDREHLIFEAPQKDQQVWFLRFLGPNVNLGNIVPDEVIPLETLRLGLRADTLFDFYEAERVRD